MRLGAARAIVLGIVVAGLLAPLSPATAPAPSVRSSGDAASALAVTARPSAVEAAAVSPTSPPRRDDVAVDGVARRATVGADERRDDVVATLVTRAKRLHAITPARAKRFAAMLDELRQQGAVAIPAIAAFLDGGEDVDFTRLDGGDLLGHRTLRQALLDTVEKIGGSAAMAVSLEQLQRTTEPLEIVIAARALDAEEPGIHRNAVLDAIGNALVWTEDQSVTTDVAPLFDLLRTYGGEQAVRTLVASVPRWGEYALIALADLPSGAGVASLTELAAADDAPLLNPVMPFETLAQASAAYPEAGDALVDLARAGRIPDDVWGPMADALEGKHLRLSAKMFDGTPFADRPADGRSPASPWRSYYVQWLNVRYEQDEVAPTWSPEQVAQQLALIDDLLAAASSPAAVQALQHARVCLQAGLSST